MLATILTQTSAIPKEEVSVNLNQDLGSRTSIYVSNVEDRVVQNHDYPPPSTYTSDGAHFYIFIFYVNMILLIIIHILSLLFHMLKYRDATSKLRLLG